MRTRHTRILRTSVSLVVVCAFGGVSVFAAEESQFHAIVPISTNEPPLTRDLLVNVKTRNNEGGIFCALWPDAQGYPVQRDRAAHDGSSKRLENRLAQIHFRAVVDGEYALACFHDENGNQTLDTNWVGIPTEGTGASNGARGFMGPPSYEAARFVISNGQPNALSIEIDY